MHSSDPCFTSFSHSIDAYEPPERFTFPFYYEPHPLCEIAAKQLQEHLESQTDWVHDFGLDDVTNNTRSTGSPKSNDPYASKATKERGKMFGVLVVKNRQGKIGFLSGFSGKIADQNLLPGFVPPVFDMLAEGSFYRGELAEVTKVSDQFKALLANPDLAEIQAELASQTAQSEHEIEAQRQRIIEGRKRRKALRAEGESNLNEQELNALIDALGKESVAEKNQLKYLKLGWDKTLQNIQSKLDVFTTKLEQLKSERARLSNLLQHKLFEHYAFLNTHGHTKDLNEIFKDTPNHIPPAGSGECAAPKLLQYAFLNDLQPLCMAEFWWGVSPKSEVRKHKKFYASCQSKCEPILGHMLQGIEMDPNPLLDNPAEGKELDILYQDDHIVVVNKPAEFLSVPGRTIKDSAAYRIEQMFTDVEGPFVIHRLDMSTSGILIFALTKRANKSLQKQFMAREVKKRYVALVEGVLEEEQGYITLPLRGDINDRPRQMVCHEHGKPAETKWEVIERTDSTTKIYLYPKTGRTHQLRVHCSHTDGLHMPIRGDDLYGLKANRLHLHAEQLQVEHPVTKEWLTFQVEADF
ncbi:RluA family pseudouridine synthase [Vibrio sp. T187]|uniref:RluA family pseudouridine synthase n=1 Tax=Vibrio TaxID=662 RepID=UPI0010C9EA22|nr:MULTISPECIES: RluA family pseudouridine synthase [Vibrio]MBW3695835.1 RluA family pseudouridine synthase [Vibrio sp. T187]